MCERENSSHAGLRTFLAAIVITISVSVVHSANDRAEIAQAADLQVADNPPEDATAPAAGPVATGEGGASTPRRMISAATR